MSASTGNNFISSMGTIASSNFLEAKFQKGADTIKNSGTPAEKEAAVKKFEAMFVSQLLKLMYDTVPVDENFGGGFAEETYRSLLTDEYGNSISKMGGIGLAKDLQRSIFDFQNVEHDTTKTIQGIKAYNKIYNL